MGLNQINVHRIIGKSTIKMPVLMSLLCPRFQVGRTAATTRAQPLRRLTRPLWPKRQDRLSPRTPAMRGRNGGNQGEAEDFLIRIIFSAISFRFFVIVVFFVFSSSALTPNKFRTAGSQGFFPSSQKNRARDGRDGVKCERYL